MSYDLLFHETQEKQAVWLTYTTLSAECQRLNAKFNLHSITQRHQERSAPLTYNEVMKLSLIGVGVKALEVYAAPPTCILFQSLTPSTNGPKALVATGDIQHSCALHS
jgi:hypothetical protein